MLEVHLLTKRYGDVTAVDHLSFTVRPGVVTGFLGPDGAESRHPCEWSSASTDRRRG